MSAPGRRGRSLEGSFTLSFAFLIVVSLAGTMWIVHSRTRGVLLAALESRGQAVAQSIGAVATPSLLAYNYAALQVAAERAVGGDVAYVVIHDKEGQVAGVAGRPPEAPGEGPPDGDPLTALQSRRLLVPDPAGPRIEVLEAVVPVHVDGVDEPWGTVRVGMRAAPVEAALHRLDLELVVIGLLLAAGAVGVGRWLARRISRPLRRLVEGTEALSSGDTSHRIPVSGPRELAELAQSFNTMVDRLRDKAFESTAYQQELAELNATLEQQVRRRTRELAESEAQYRSVVEHSPDSILIVQRGRVRFVNQAFEQIFRIPARDALAAGFALESLFDESCRSTLADRLEAWEEGRPQGPAMLVTLPHGGRPRELELRGSPIEFGSAPAAGCMLVDVTETRRLQAQLEDAQRLRALGELSSGVAHDFNNLLGAILGRAQLLRGRELGETVDSSLAVIERAARDGRETVRRIQEFARTRVDRPVDAVDLGQALLDALEMTRTFWTSDASRRNAHVDIVERVERGTVIRGNDHELREVFTNLIINAVDAMPDGGTLTLACRRDGEQVVADLEDSGRGMPEEVRRHLFDPFFTTKGPSGTGLGMSVVYGIVTRHDGTIDVTSSPGCGTRFTLSFPAADGVVAEADGADEGEPDAPRPRGRILVIDDEQPIADLLEDALSGDGHEVEVALSAPEGVRLAGERPFDLVLTDLGMPEMSGWEVASRIRSRENAPPVVLVTGWGTTITQDEIDEAGVLAVVHKPFEIAELLRTAGAALARRRR